LFHPTKAAPHLTPAPDDSGCALSYTAHHWYEAMRWTAQRVKMMDTNKLQVMAGALSSTMFVLGTLPMLLKAWRTKDLHSYSLGNIALSNAGNLIHWLYISSLPFGPIWFLHSFHTLTTLVMLVWFIAYRHKPTQSA
jgi:uncharacterized protein with PQ loop repeat